MIWVLGRRSHQGGSCGSVNRSGAGGLWACGVFGTLGDFSVQGRVQATSSFACRPLAPPMSGKEQRGLFEGTLRRVATKPAPQSGASTPPAGPNPRLKAGKHIVHLSTSLGVRLETNEQTHSPRARLHSGCGPQSTNPNHQHRRSWRSNRQNQQPSDTVGTVRIPPGFRTLKNTSVLQASEFA